MKKLKIITQSTKYDVIIGKNIFSQIDSDLNKANEKVLFICDSNVFRMHKRKIDSLLKLKSNYHQYIFTATEKNKTLKTVEFIYDYLISCNFSRTDKIVAIGGGIVGDVAGFAAATYMRGLIYYQVPTTLLSMVDSSVGGKTAVNYLNVKNLIGSFHHPGKVYVDLNFLSTLPAKEIISGAGEIFKYAFLIDKQNYDFIRKSLFSIVKTRQISESLIAKCIQIKSAVVGKDEFETKGLRKILNLGHTFAHAFESASNFTFTHGEAVIAGIFSSLIVSKKINLISASELEQYLYDFSFLPINKKIFNTNPAKIIEYMKADKKTSARRIKLVLVSKPGNLFIDVIVDEKIVKESITELSNLSERFKKKTVGW